MERHEFTMIELSYATVREYNQLVEVLPELSPIATDLKNIQRPWVVRKILDKMSTGRVLEIGADRCQLADYLSKRGFEVWVIDAYDNWGGGRARLEEVRSKFPNLNIYKGFMHEDKALPSYYFDVIYSCSVLEHTPIEYIEPTVRRIDDCLRSGGFSIHAVDFTVEGIMVYHKHRNEILRCHGAKATAEDVAKQAISDVETFYLSPQGHYMWRKFLQKSYEEYPYRKVTSLNLVARKDVQPCRVM